MSHSGGLHQGVWKKVIIAIEAFNNNIGNLIYSVDKSHLCVLKINEVKYINII